eukprot:TRINITY_DN345_c0_g1_i1.p1 TRINITY_DN345_c0_g1~~TRINITY_DN345_c0_g1_i1.p1  ORF type:complete len:159 (-),score=72.16 TRINITY_DN345_c0_g1_i1:187-663(-)
MSAEDVAEEQDIFYVCKSALEEVKVAIKDGKDVSDELISKLTSPEDLADEEVMVPVDMRGVGEDFDDIEQMVEKLGNKGTAEAFVKAVEFFETSAKKIPEDDRPKPMTAQEWRTILEEDGGLEGGEEELMLEGEEEEFDGDEEGEDAEEPPEKKAKTA